jgi:hypothetical protein
MMAGLIFAVYVMGVVIVGVWASIRYHRDEFIDSFMKTRDGFYPTVLTLLWPLAVPFDRIVALGAWWTRRSETKKRTDAETIELLQKRIAELEGCYRTPGTGG